MKQRGLIKSQIIDAWSRSIKEDYYSQRINSERSLQASFWSHLNELIPKNRRLFIEPTLSITINRKIEKVIPDIVVCNTKSVIAVIELKYLPRAAPRYKKDIQTLSRISENRNQIKISNQRYRGQVVDGKNYLLSKHILFVWAGVHAKSKHESDALYSTGLDSLKNCYLELHCETNHGDRPSMYYKS